MQQRNIGKYIAQKRKEKNLTQAQLAERLHVSNKTISKWETGVCMPDYSVVEALCAALEISVAELMAGADAEKSAAPDREEAQMLELIREIRQLQQQRGTLYGVLLIVMGIALLAVAGWFGGSAFQDFLGGLLCGLAVGEMLVGLYLAGKSLLGR